MHTKPFQSRKSAMNGVVANRKEKPFGVEAPRKRNCGPQQIPGGIQSGTAGIVAHAQQVFSGMSGTAQPKRCYFDVRGLFDHLCVIADDALRVLITLFIMHAASRKKLIDFAHAGAKRHTDPQVRVRGVRDTCVPASNRVQDLTPKKCRGLWNPSSK